MKRIWIHGKFPRSRGRNGQFLVAMRNVFLLVIEPDLLLHRHSQGRISSICTNDHFGRQSFLSLRSIKGHLMASEIHIRTLVFKMNLSSQALGFFHQQLIEFSSGNGVNRLVGFAIRNKGGTTMLVMDFAAKHRNSQRHHLVFQTDLLETFPTPMA